MFFHFNYVNPLYILLLLIITGSKKYCSLYRELRYIEVRHIEVPPYQAWKFFIAVLSIAFLAC